MVAKNKIIGILKDILVELDTIDFIIMVRGFSGSKLLTDEIKSNPAFSAIKFISPKDPGTVVLQGAVLFGHSPCAVSARICRYSQGIRVLKPFGSKIHPQSKLVIINGDEVCKDVFMPWCTKMSQLSTTKRGLSRVYRIIEAMKENFIQQRQYSIKPKMW